MSELLEAAFKKLKKNLKGPKITILNTEEKMYYNQNYSHIQPFIKKRLLNNEKDFEKLLKISKFEKLSYQGKENKYFYGMIMSLTGNNLCRDNIFLCGIENDELIFVKLTLSENLPYILHSGLIVAIEAKSYANTLLVRQIFSMPKSYVGRNDPGSLNVMIKKGPFSTEDFSNHNYSTFECIILFGPFLPSFHFEDFISAIEKNILHVNNFTSVVLVPSLEDKEFFNVIPQAGFNTFNQRIICCSNPSIIRINDHLFNLANYDVLKMIKSAEISSQNSPEEFLNLSDEISRLCFFLIYQKTFLPVFPTTDILPVFGDSLNFMLIPDIYLTSSKLNFLENNDKLCTVINVNTDENEFLTLEYCSRNDSYKIEKSKFL